MRKMAALLTLLLTACCGEEITETAHRSARTSILPIAGELESARSVMVAPPAIDRMWQYSIKRMVPENSHVEEGEVVVAFDDKAVRERLIEKKSELKQWRSELNNTLLKEKQTAKDDILAIEEKRAEFEARSRQQDAFSKTEYPAGAQLCAKCSTAAVVMMDGCMTCLSCGDSKCG